LGLPDVVPDHEMLYPEPRVPPEGETKIAPFPPLQGTLDTAGVMFIAGGSEIVKVFVTGQLLLSSIVML
jgi:hypothetical protein